MAEDPVLLTVTATDDTLPSVTRLLASVADIVKIPVMKQHKLIREYKMVCCCMYW